MDRAGRPLVRREAGLLGDVQDVELVVGHAPALLDGELGRADVHAAIELHRVGADDLAVQPQGQLDREVRLACGRRPDHREDWLHGQESVSGGTVNGTGAVKRTSAVKRDRHRKDPSMQLTDTIPDPAPPPSAVSPGHDPVPEPRPRPRPTPDPGPRPRARARRPLPDPRPGRRSPTRRAGHRRSPGPAPGRWSADSGAGAHHGQTETDRSPGSRGVARASRARPPGAPRHRRPGCGVRRRRHPPAPPSATRWCGAP